MKTEEHEDRIVRGLAGQQSRRMLEKSVRCETVAFVRWMHLHGVARPQAARRVGLSVSTVGHWEENWKAVHLKSEARGRPVQTADRETRETIDAISDLMGPGVGLAVLQEFFPEVARRELEYMQHLYRHTHWKRSRALIHALRWKRVGAVWAMDYAEPPVPVDGIYPWILVVRDLTSGKQLLALPVEKADAPTTMLALKALLRQHGVPLVIKTDNGSAFIAMEMEDFLEQQEVYHLLSPPRIPSYNGACEAGIGSLKTRAHHESARHDRPGEWTCDDVEAARLRSNETSRPGGFHAPTPNERWNLRLLISADERQQFRERVEAFREEVRVERGCAIGADLSRSMRASMNRRAISRALVAQGILEFRWRQITLPILRQKSATIS